jgi:hypothetical protein
LTRTTHWFLPNIYTNLFELFRSCRQTSHKIEWSKNWDAFVGDRDKLYSRVDERQNALAVFIFEIPR